MHKDVNIEIIFSNVFHFGLIGNGKQRRASAGSAVRHPRAHENSKCWKCKISDP